MDPHPRQLADFARIADDGPHAARAFFAWYGEVTAGPALGQRLAALIALATAHALRCPYCIDAWTSSALQRGLDAEEMMAAVHIAARVQASVTVDQARLAFDRLRRIELREPHDERPPYAARHTPAAKEEAHAAGGGAQSALDAWTTQTREPTVLAPSEGAALELAVAHALRSPEAIVATQARANAAGLSAAQQMEAVHIAAALQAGATLVHATLMREAAQRPTTGAPQP